MMQDVLPHREPNQKLVYLALGALTFGVLFLLRAAEISGMSSGFVSDIKEGNWDFFPHHLLYQPGLRVLDLLFGSTFCDAICIGQLHSIFWGVVTVLSIYTIAKRVIGTGWGGIGTAAFVISVHGFLVFSVQVEPYVPILGIASLLAAFIVVRAERGFAWRHIAVLSVLFSLSLFLHQAMVLMLIPLGFYLLATHGRRGVQIIFIVALISGTIVLGTYIVVYWASNPGAGIRDFFNWMMYYQVISDESHGSFRDLFNQRIRQAVRSFTQLYVVIPEDFRSDAIFGLRQKPLRFLIAAVLPTILIWNMVQLLRGASGQNIRMLMLIWLITFGLFFLWWQPGVYKFFIPTITPTIVLGAMMVRDIFAYWGTRRWPRVTIVFGTVLVAALMMGTNLSATVLPLATSQGPIYLQARKLNDARRVGCNVYSMRYLNGYLNYYFDVKARPFNLMFRKHHYTTVAPDIAKTIHVETTFENEACALIPLYWLSQEYFAARTTQAIGQYLQPEDWGRFIAWFFDVRKEAGTHGITYSDFEVVSDQDGDRYVVIDRSARAQVAELGSLLDRINSLYQERPGGAFSLKENPSLGRRRHLAFGYN